MWWAIEWYDLLERLGDPDAGQEKERPVVNLEFGGKGQNRLASPVGEKKKKKCVGGGGGGGRCNISDLALQAL